MTVISKENSFELFLDNGIKPEHTVTFLAFDGVKWLELNSKPSVPENEWSHIAVVINQNQISLYLDGEIQETKFIESDYFNLVDYALTSDDRVNTNESQVVIGASEVDGELVDQFSGELGDVVIYDYALTGDEILELFTNTIFENSLDTLGVENDELVHGQIEINQPVIWIRNVSFESEVSSSALDLPNDALLMHVHVTTSEGDIITLFDYATQLSKDIEIIDATKTSEILKTIKQVDRFILINIDGQDVVYSSMDLNAKLLEDEGIKKIIVINHPAQHVSVTFATGVPAQYEEDISDSDSFAKKVKVSHRSNLHYTDIPVCSEISENLVESGVDFRLYWIVDGEQIDVTDDETFNVHFVDSDGNGIDDQMCWTVPQLSEQNYVISADLSVINVQSYPVVNGNWDVKFTTTGTADLTVTGIDGTTFGDSLPDDLKFLSLFNGTKYLEPIINENSLTFADYSSTQQGVFSSQVLTDGKHHLQFSFGNDVELASNSASELLVDTSLIPLLVSPSSNVSTCESPTELGILSTGFDEPGIHNIVASTLFNRESTAATTVNVWLEDQHGTVLAENHMNILLNNNDRSNGYVLIAQNQNGEANAAYVVKACTTNDGVFGEAKITAFDGLERTVFADGELWDQTKIDNTLVSVETTFPAGDNVILVSVQVDSDADQVVPADSIQILNRFGTSIASNQYHLELGSTPPRDIQSFFLVTTDYDAPPDATYSVVLNAENQVKMEAKILAIQPAGVFFDSDKQRHPVSDTGVKLANVSTDYDVDDDVIVISAGQFDDEDTGIERILPGAYEILENYIPVSINDMSLVSQGGASNPNNFAYTLIHRTLISISDSTFTVNATSSSSGGIVGESKLVSFIPKDAGPPPGPTISSIVVSGEAQVTPTFSDGDEIAVIFSAGTNRPTAAEKTDIESLFTFWQNGAPISMGKNFIGSWASPTTLVITFVDTDGHQSPAIGSLQIEINGSEGVPSLIKSADGLSQSSIGISPVLEGDFGTPAGPSITSIIASDADPDNPSTGVTPGDTITMRFSEDTNYESGTTWLKPDLDSAFDFIQGVEVAKLADDYVGVWKTPRTLVITLSDSNGDPVIGGLKIMIDEFSSLPIKNLDSTSFPSNSISPVLEGTWGQGIGPQIISFVADDPDGANAGASVSGSNEIFGNGDTLTITFGDPTNEPSPTNLSNLFSFVDDEENPISIGTATAEWIDPFTLKITITNSQGNNVGEAVGSIKAQTLASGLIKSGFSLPSESLSPPLSGTFGEKSGPAIVSVTVSGDTPGITSDDKLTIKFSEPTNRPSASTSQEIDSLLTITPKDSSSKLILGSDFTGKWVSSSILEVIVIDESGNNCSALFTLCDVDGKLIVKINSDGNLKNEQGTSLVSESTSPSASGSFGIKEGPSIISLKANDPSDDGGVEPGFSLGDTLRLRFSEPTNLAGFIENQVLNRTQVNTLFLFSQSLSDNYTGKWINSQTFDIVITDATIDSPPTIDELRITAKSAGNILDAQLTSSPSKATSPPLTGTFGDKPGPSIISVTAKDPFGNNDGIVDKGDTLTLKFSEPTNMKPLDLTYLIQNEIDPHSEVISKFDLDSILEFTHPIGTDYTSQWIDPTTLVITINDDLVETIPITQGVPDSTFRIKVLESANLKDTDEVSLPSISQSPAISGTFGSKPGPDIVSLTVGDTNTPPAPGYSSGDEIVVLFSEATNKPSISTKSEIDSVLTFASSSNSFINLGTSLSGIWVNPYTLKISVINSDGSNIISDSAIGDVTAKVKVESNLRDAAGTSLASQSISPPLKGTFGEKPGPSIKSLVVQDPDDSDSVYSVGDVFSLRFSEPTNQDVNAGTLTRNDLDKLFTFTQSIGDNYSGVWSDSMTVEITIDEITQETPPQIGELRVIAKASGGIQAFGGSDDSTSTSPALTGSYGNFEEIIVVNNGGTATTTLPSGLTTSLELDDTSSGTLSMESLDGDENLALCETDPETGECLPDENTALISFLGQTLELNAEDTDGDGEPDVPCSPENLCTIEIIFDIVDLEGTGITDPYDVKIVHDKDDDGSIESPDNGFGEDEILETTVIQLDESTYLASGDVDHFSKFAVGGVKALALGALAGAINSDVPNNGNDPSSPQIGKAQITSLGNPTNGFGGTIGQVSLDEVEEKLILNTDEDLVFNLDLYEDQGISNVYHAEIYFDFGGLELNTNDPTSIIYDKDSALQVYDPKQFFTNAELKILEKDAYNGVLQVKLNFQKPMDTSSIKIVTSDLEKNTSEKIFENVIRVEPYSEPITEIPNWVKSSASWWSNDQISDEDFVQGIEFLVKENIISVDDVQTTESSSEIPSWIKYNAQWWSEDILPDDEFVMGIEYLIKTGILSVK